MSNVKKASPAVEVILNGKTRTLKLTLGAFAKLEEVTGKNALSDEAWADPTATTIVALVWAALNDETATMEEVGSWIWLSEVSTIAQLIKEAMEQAMPEAGKNGIKNEESPRAKPIG